MGIFRYLIGLFTSVRSYNVIVVTVAQYLSALFIFSKRGILETLSDWNLHLLILATACSVAAGYLINNFYDKERDSLNNPIRTQLSNALNTQIHLYYYIVFNFMGLALASLVSGKAVLFFIVYQVLLWFYSHKVNKILFINNLAFSILSIFPVFALLLYYKDFAPYLLVHAGFLGSILLISDITKDLRTATEDAALGYKTLPNQFGEQYTKVIIGLLSLLNILFAIGIIQLQQIGKMQYYFELSIFLVLFALFYLLQSKNKQRYFIAQQIFKGIIVLGIFSIILIKF